MTCIEKNVKDFKYMDIETTNIILKAIDFDNNSYEIDIGLDFGVLGIEKDEASHERVKRIVHFEEYIDIDNNLINDEGKIIASGVQQALYFRGTWFLLITSELLE